MLLEAWNDILRGTCGYYHALPQEKRHVVTGHFLHRLVYGLDAADFSGDISQIYRTRQDTKQDESDNLYLIVPIIGNIKMDQDGEQAIVRPGQLYLHDSRHPVKMLFETSQFHGISVHLPRSLLLAEAESPLYTGPCAQYAAAQEQLLRAHVVASLTRQRPLPHADASYLLDLARTAFAQGADTTSPCFRRASQSLRYNHAVRDMEQHLTHPDLSLAWLAQRIGISPRQLERDFQAHDDSFVGCLREKRLKLSCALARLAYRTGQEVRVIDLAFAAGFRDLSNFNRAFRHKFNQTPKDYLHRLAITPDHLPLSRAGDEGAL